MMRISKKTTIAIGSLWAAAFVIAFISYLLFIQPKAAELDRVKEKLVKKKQEAGFAQKATQQQAKNKIQNQLNKSLKQLDEFSVEYDDAASMLLLLSQIAEETELSGFKTNRKQGLIDVAGCKGLAEGRVFADFDADFFEFAAFINTLERNRPVIFIDSFTITNNGLNSPDHTVNLGLAVFIRKKQEAESASLASIKQNLLAAEEAL